MWHIHQAKTHGFPPDWVEAMVGHKSSTQAHYIPPDIAKEWLEMCQPHLQVLAPPTPIQITQEATPEQLDRITKDIEGKLLLRLLPYMNKIAALESENRQLKAMRQLSDNTAT